MATGQHNIRIYDLAKELKLDNKKVMEDARREGIDVSVPSNTVPHEVAERIRLKYFPKKIVPQVGPRLVKHVKQAEPAAGPAEAARATETPSPASPGIPTVQRPPTQVRVLRPRPGAPPLAARPTGSAGAGYPGAPGGATVRTVGAEGGVATETGTPAAR